MPNIFFYIFLNISKFPSKYFYNIFTFWSMIHLKLIFVLCELGIRAHCFHIDIYLFQYHLLKRLSFLIGLFWNLCRKPKILKKKSVNFELSILLYWSNFWSTCQYQMIRYCSFSLSLEIRLYKLVNFNLSHDYTGYSGSCISTYSLKLVCQFKKNNNNNNNLMGLWLGLILSLMSGKWGVPIFLIII